MTKAKTLITVASWEDRFHLGIRKIVNDCSLSRVVMFYYKEFEERTANSRNEVETLFREKGVGYSAVPIAFGDAPGTWQSIYESIGSIVSSNAPVLMDLSTMPRETLWAALCQLERYRTPTSYIYHSPADYADWLSRDPGRPRLVYKLSGIATIGRQTCLVITTGYDPERTRQLMWYYEPRRILLGFQDGRQFQNDVKNVQRHRDSLKEEYREFEVEEFELDAYADDHGESVISKQIEKWQNSHNIVMTSLGPKLGAIALFRVHSQHPETSLAYAPSNEFNPDYSTGISQSHFGEIQW
ncbi:MAG: hypothetical protein SGI77_13950 [Pirellulaceae bacterium]|nr:hypothetical protein [Pirellulaceae bacterium]